jgi:hypothetical protein
LSAGRKTLQGRFFPINPQKYKGDPSGIVYRSSWELLAMKRFDTDPRIKWWSSEELHIKYYNPVKEREARYFIDFVICIASKLEDKIVAIEVKPHYETGEPRPAKDRHAKSRHRYLTEKATYAVNCAKWEAATQFCQMKGWTFMIMTEYELGLKKRPQKT